MKTIINSQLKEWLFTFNVDPDELLEIISEQIMEIECNLSRESYNDALGETYLDIIE